MSKLRTRRAEEKAQRAESILQAAKESFFEKGFSKTTIGDIAEKVRLSRSLIYTYFYDMEHLLCCVVLEGLEQLKKDFRRAIEKKENGLQGIVAIGRAYVHFALKNPESYQAISVFQTMENQGPKQMGENPTDLEKQNLADLKAVNTIAEEINALMASQIECGIADGSIRPDVGTPAKIAMYLWAQTSGLIQFATLQEKTLKGAGVRTKKSFLEEGILLLSRSLEHLPRN